jgi:PAS domain-containing protein
VALGLLTVFIIDPLDPTTVSTPFCLGIVLMAVSLRQSTSLVTAISAAYCALTVIALLRFHHYVSHIYVSPHPSFWLFQRMGLFFVLCGLAIYMAYYRTGTDRLLTRLRAILGKLHTPVILSDASGNIVYANEAITPLLQQTAAQITGKSYFNFLRMGGTKGESIRAYFDRFEAETNGIYELEIAPFGAENTVPAQISCLGTGPSRVMITVLWKADERLDPRVAVEAGSSTRKTETQGI